MANISAIFWDLGGVLLTNAWDRSQREKTLQKFQLDSEEFHDRHEMLVSSLERGKIGFDEYLDHTVFYRSRPFSREEFKKYVFDLSQANENSIAVARKLAASCRYLMGTINNESTDLNIYRIDRFGLREIFDLFVSSCFVGMRKPEEGIYRLALEITQQSPEQCCFIDDRPLNVDAARRLGMHGIEMKSVEQLTKELRDVGVEFG
ncbi:MAG TPA: HAD family phosphatase [Terriglobales bacterium]|nr:HAD family phosphatase [Terriglobales bacterium]